MGIINKSRILNPVNLAVCLVQVMVLLHTDKDIVQAAFNA